jgi:putative acyl-CoA dehydrogenase
VPPDATHEVLNQVPPLTGYDVAADAALLAALHREGGGWAEDELHELGRLAGAESTQEAARLANVYRPVLRTHDSRGNRIDEVEFHPAWHELMATAVAHGLHATPWTDERPGAHVARAAKFIVWTQAEAGHGCPVSMTYASIPALRQAPGLAATFEPLLASAAYDPGLRVPAGKAGLLAGMAMTEKQGGSDVRANTTRAVPASTGPGDGSYLLTGHKWFCSAPMCDLFLVLAQAPEGLTCFLLPRVLPDGSRNAMHIQRLKDKLGNTSNASAEVEYRQAIAWPVGELGRGIATILDMVSATRLDCVLGSAAGIRQAVVTAAHHTRYRSAFGARLIDQPAMAAVIADLTLESEAATTLALRLAGAADRASRGDAAEAALLRLALPAAKYWICKRAPMITAEALECLGGNGYVEESVMPRLLRDSPLNSIWEGSGNVTALDVLRALGRAPEAAGALLAEIDQAAGIPAVAAAAARLRAALKDAAGAGAGEGGAAGGGAAGGGAAGAGAGDRGAAAHLHARPLAGQITVALQAALLARHAPGAVADAFCASRLGTGRLAPAETAGPGTPFGCLPSGLDLAPILERSAVVTK